jgi:nitrogen fixation protein FixH
MTTDTAPKLTGRKVFLIFACFFGTIVAADAFLITSAVRTWSGTEATSAYKAGQLYNGQLAQARAQDERGWQVEASTKREADGALRLAVDLRDASGAPLTSRTLAATLERPIDKRQDRALKLVEAADGSYVAVADGIAAGQWDLVVDVMEGEGLAFRRRMRVVLR